MELSHDQQKHLKLYWMIASKSNKLQNAKDLFYLNLTKTLQLLKVVDNEKKGALKLVKSFTHAF